VARCGLAGVAGCGAPHVYVPCVLYTAQVPALSAHAACHTGSGSAAAQVDFGQASSLSAADAFVTAVLFAPDIAAQLFLSDAAFQARARGPCTADGWLHAARVLRHTYSPRRALQMPVGGQGGATPCGSLACERSQLARMW
jgi:hypothetical protein